ncbi:MAG: ArsR family transcriptional regulator [Desulforudis sp.]|nr:MAG: ArsR family transcriptional regulator [Desulforudis sp.]
MRAMVEYLKALSDETRLRIIQLLSGGEKCVCELVYALNMSQSAVSHHLRILRQAGLIRDRREGKWVFYAIERENFLRDHQRFADRCVKPVEGLVEPEDHSLGCERCRRLEGREKGIPSIEQ